MASAKAAFFEQEAAKQKPKPVKKEVVWRPTQGKDGHGAVGAGGGTRQTKKQMDLGAPPAKKSLADLP
eukprot:CAMPEP_0119124404 /NCGR_PEP_ID=MMETSP1310-20130426/4044_1 /TAXON_ID=464262 /ORGANISM="Genus nov. species nov., Strain RCC2339" /LENGTH=67 /DNA_ID=CAMNT_0007114353 /DNA_START=97 /DNA_END=300 /DNA_ORIENTATION=+